MGQRSSHDLYKKRPDVEEDIERRHTLSLGTQVNPKRFSTLNLARKRSVKVFRNASSLNLSGTLRQKLRPTKDRPKSDRKLSDEELVSINTSSEEQLMTLPGVDRALAKAIVKRRLIIGRFEKIDDLAEVPGVGKEKLDRIRSEASTSGETVEKGQNSLNASLDSVFSAAESSKPSNNAATTYTIVD